MRENFLEVFKSLKWEKVKWSNNEIDLKQIENFPTKIEGFYFIRTSFTLEVLKTTALEDRINHNEHLKNLGFTYRDSSEDPWIVYNGENQDVRGRIISHFNSHDGTGGLKINKNSTLTVDDKWEFAYIPLKDIFPEASSDAKKNKCIRTYLEQLWRGEKGWPILCKE